MATTTETPTCSSALPEIGVDPAQHARSHPLASPPPLAPGYLPGTRPFDPRRLDMTGPGGHRIPYVPLSTEEFDSKFGGKHSPFDESEKNSEVKSNTSFEDYEFTDDELEGMGRMAQNARNAQATSPKGQLEIRRNGVLLTSESQSKDATPPSQPMVTIHDVTPVMMEDPVTSPDGNSFSADEESSDQPSDDDGYDTEEKAENDRLLQAWSSKGPSVNYSIRDYLEYKCACEARGLLAHAEPIARYVFADVIPRDHMEYDGRSVAYCGIHSWNRFCSEYDDYVVKELQRDPNGVRYFFDPQNLPDHIQAIVKGLKPTQIEVDDRSAYDSPDGDSESESEEPSVQDDHKDNLLPHSDDSAASPVGQLDERSDHWESDDDDEEEHPFPMSPSANDSSPSGTSPGKCKIVRPVASKVVVKPANVSRLGHETDKVTESTVKLTRKEKILKDRARKERIAQRNEDRIDELNAKLVSFIEERERRSAEKKQKRLSAQKRACDRAAGFKAYVPHDELPDFCEVAPVCGEETAGKPKNLLSSKSPDESMTKNFLHCERMFRYFHTNYCGDDLETCLELASAKGFPHHQVTQPWWYEVGYYDAEDQRLNTKLITKSECVTHLKMRLFTLGDDENELFRRKAFWRRWLPILVFIFIFLMMSIIMLSWILEKHHISFLVTALTSIAALWYKFSKIFDWIYEKDLFREIPMLSSSINLAHLLYAKRQNADGSESLLRAKLRDVDHYRTDLATQSQAGHLRDFALSLLTKSNIIWSPSEIRSSPFAQHPQKEVEECAEKNLKLKNFSPIDIRAFESFPSSFGDIERCQVPPIEVSAIKHAYYKRVQQNRRPPMSTNMNRLLRKILLEGAGEAQVKDSMSIKDYAEYLIRQKGFTEGQRRQLRTRAEELENLDDRGRIDALRNGLMKTSWFIKDECYPEGKDPNLRIIINPETDVKLIFGSVLKPIEEIIYYDSPMSKYLIKGKDREALALEFEEKFGDVGSYLETDYSSFESCIGVEELDSEFEVYKSKVPLDCYALDVLEVVRKYHCTEHKQMHNPVYGTLTIPAMRLSGMPNTALGNALLNYGNLELASRISLTEIQDMWIEGDDSLVSFPDDQSREKFLDQLNAQRFIARDTQFFTRGTDASFCGMRIVDGVIVPTQLQIDKLSIVFSRTELTPAVAYSRSAARLISYWVKYPGYRFELLELFNELHASYPDTKLHSGRVWKFLLEDWFSLSSGGLLNECYAVLQNVIGERLM